MNINLRRHIKTGRGKNGSYITEAALSLPVLIIAVCSLALIIRIETVCEGVCFGTAQVVREESLEAAQNITTVSLCKRIEKRVLREEPSLTEFRASDMRYMFSRNGIRDLISVDVKADFKVVNAVGINGKIDFGLRLMARCFTGAEKDSKPLAEEGFCDDGDSVKVCIFPRYGARFHRSGCRYEKIYDKRGSYKLTMEKREAELKGFTPCAVCGGGNHA